MTVPYALEVTDGVVTRIRLGVNAAEAAESRKRYAKLHQLLEEVRSGRRPVADFPAAPLPGGFAGRVIAALMELPRGRLTSYGELARRCGAPGAARAVGRALAGNPLPLLYPCHRVGRADGSPGGFMGSTAPEQVALKLVLLREEQDQ